MSVIADLPDIRPSLLLDFANSGRVDPRIQCTRASAATCFGPDGKLRTVAANVPRIDYDPATGMCLGLLIEESRANLLTHSESLDDGAWVKSSGSSVTPNNALAPDGTLTAETVINSGGSSATNRVQQFTNHAVSAGLVATFTVWLRADTPFTTALRVANQGDADGENSTVTLTARWQRFSLTRVFTISSPSIRVCIGNSANNGTFEVWGAQLEIGAFPTSYIPTEASAVTRAADIATVPAHQLSAFGTLLGKYSKAGWKHTSTPPVGALDLSKRIDTAAQVNDTIERLMLYPRQLTAAQITRLTA